MVAFEVSRDITAGRHEVWRVLSDVMCWSQWNTTVTKIESLGSSHLHIGSRFRVWQPKLRPAVWEVTAVDPPSGFVWTAKSTGMTIIASHCVSAITPTQSQLTLRFVFKGWLGVVASRVLGRLVQDYLTKEAEALRQAVGGRLDSNCQPLTTMNVAHHAPRR